MYKIIYVLHWKGYLMKARKRPEMFSQEQLDAIFGNIEEIYSFAKKLLTDLETRVSSSNLCNSSIGDVFLQHVREPLTDKCNDSIIIRPCVFEATM